MGGKTYNYTKRYELLRAYSNFSSKNYVAAYSLTKKVVYLFLNIFTVVEFFKSSWSLFHITGPIIVLTHIDFSVVLQ